MTPLVEQVRLMTNYYLHIKINHIHYDLNVLDGFMCNLSFDVVKFDEVDGPPIARLH